jgi:hypothetical protein
LQDDWPARSKWTWDYLKKEAGDVKVSYREVDSGYAFQPNGIADKKFKISVLNLPTGKSYVTQLMKPLKDVIDTITQGRKPTDPYHYIQAVCSLIISVISSNLIPHFQSTLWLTYL